MLGPGIKSLVHGPAVRPYYIMYLCSIHLIQFPRPWRLPNLFKNKLQWGPGGGGGGGGGLRAILRQWYMLGPGI